MNALTTTERKVLNGMSRIRDVDVKLGDIIAGLIGSLGESGTPVNAVAADEIFVIDGVSIDGETLTINNPAVPGTDVYEFLTDAAQTKTVPTNIAVNISASTTKASGTLTLAAQPTSGDTMTIGEKTYIFVPVGTANADGEISIGADLATANLNVVAAINGTDEINTAHPLVTAAAFNANNCTITALIGGTVNNTVATSETFTAGTNVFAAATLGSGADCSAANTAAALIAAINANDTQGVTASAGTGTNVVLTADVGGVTGNAILVSDTMANGAMTAAATKLSGGVDGTVAVGTKFMVDTSYLYVAPTGNTAAQANWRRISLGSAY